MNFPRDAGSFLRRLTRAEYAWQPLQLGRRVVRRCSTAGQSQLRLRTAWGLPMVVNPQESIGRSLVALNTLDLPVAETIWRLLDEGEAAADVGANIGVMTSVMAARLCAGGTITSFEPVPQLARRLRDHLRLWQRLSRARIELHEKAVSDRHAPAELYLPADFELNNGMASLAFPTDTPPSQRLVVDCCTLDEIFPEDSGGPSLIKVDVEGWEAAVFRGAHRLLSPGRIRDIIFEELRPQPTETVAMLRAFGYTVFRIARGFLRPRLLPAEAALRYEIDPPSYLATRDPARALARFRRIGWFSLRTPRTPPSAGVTPGAN